MRDGQMLKLRKSLSLITTVVIFWSCKAVTPPQPDLQTDLPTTGTSTIRAKGASLSAEVPNCSALSNLRDTELDATAVLRKCIKDTPSGGSLALAAGAYTISGTLTMEKPITIKTAGILPSDPTCTKENSAPCAIIRASANFQGNAWGSPRGFMLHGRNGNQRYEHIIVDGRKQIRNIRPGMDQHSQLTFWENNFDSKLIGSVITNSPLGSGFVIDPNSKRVEISRSIIRDNGNHRNMVSDGLTVLGSRGAVISRNEFINNTDLDLITGECPGCLIEFNRFTHVGAPMGEAWLSSSFAALGVSSWPMTSADYTDARIENNYVDCGPSRGCGSAYILGTAQWWSNPIFTPTDELRKLGWSFPPLPVRGLVFRNNFATNAWAGIQINRDVTNTVKIGNNYASPTTGGWKCPVGDGSLQNLFRYSISPISGAQIDGPIVNAFYYMKADYINQVPNSNSGGCVAATVRDSQASPTPTGSIQLFEYLIAEAYLELMGRSPNSNEMSDHTNRFLAFKVTEQTLRNEIRGSSEYQKKTSIGQELKIGKSISNNQSIATSGIRNDCGFNARMQSDGNLVLSRGVTPIWSSGTTGSYNGSLIMQGDGNLVVYRTNGTAAWSAGIANKGGIRLAILGSGRLVIYNAAGSEVWSSGAAVAGCSIAPIVSAPLGTSPPSSHFMIPGSALTSGQSLIGGGSCAVTAKMQVDGSLLIFRNGIAVRGYGIVGNSGAVAKFSSDGNFTVTRANGSPAFSSGTSGRGGKILILQTDGNLVIYDANNLALWTSGTSLASCR